MVDDFSIFTGKYADLNGDGRVDMAEYLIDECDYDAIMRHNDNDDDFSVCCDDYDENEEECYYEADEELEIDSCEISDENTTKVSLSFSPGSNDDENIIHRKAHCETLEEYYYDTVYKCYHIADAIYEHFPTVSGNFERNEVIDNFEGTIHKIYTVDKQEGLQILIWLVDNFPNALHGAACHPYTQLTTYSIIVSMIYRDNNTDEDVILKYIYEHPDFEKKVLGEQFMELAFWYDDDYMCYLAKLGDTERILSSYRTFSDNPNVDKKKYPKEKLLEDILFNLNINHIRNVDKRLYDFFREEIESVCKPIKIKYLMEKLEFEDYGGPIFCKTYGKASEMADTESENCDKNQDEPVNNEYSDVDEEKYDIYSRLLQKISDLEEGLNAANKRIEFLESNFGISEKR